MLRQAADAKPAPTRFMVVSTQRSGSTWLVDLLNSHPEVVCYGALFLPRHSKTPAGGQDRKRFSSYLAEDHPGASRARSPLLAWRFLDDVYRGNGDSASIGFKFMYSQFRLHPWVLAYARVRGVRILHLIRDNKLDHVLSKESAKTRGAYHARSGESVFTPPVYLDPHRLVDQLTEEEKKVRSARRVLRLLRLPVLEVHYEELVSDRHSFTEALSFLGVEPRTELLRSDLQRWSRGAHNERIANYAAVRAALEGTRFSRLLT